MTRIARANSPRANYGGEHRWTHKLIPAVFAAALGLTACSSGNQVPPRPPHSATQAPSEDCPDGHPVNFTAILPLDVPSIQKFIGQDGADAARTMRTDFVEGVAAIVQDRQLKASDLKFDVQANVLAANPFNATSAAQAARALQNDALTALREQRYVAIDPEAPTTSPTIYNEPNNTVAPGGVRVRGLDETATCGHVSA